VECIILLGESFIIRRVKSKIENPRGYIQMGGAVKLCALGRSRGRNLWGKNNLRTGLG